jgi:hypothetical protein
LIYLWSVTHSFVWFYFVCVVFVWHCHWSLIKSLIINDLGVPTFISLCFASLERRRILSK